MERYCNWMSYSFDGIEYGKKQSKTSVFTLNFNRTIEGGTTTYYQALLDNAGRMRDTYAEPFDVLLSDGIDSEVVVRTFKDLGIRHNTFIYRLENDLNVRDVQGAITLCNELGNDYKIVDFNLQQFFDHDALSYFNKSFIPNVRRLCRLKWIEQLDNIPVFGDGEPYWTKVDGVWKLHFSECGYTNSLYAKSIGKTAICDWYEFTPDVIWMNSNLPLTQDLINDRLPGKTSSWTSRYEIHREIWPTLRLRHKLVGYEGQSGAVGTQPTFLDEFKRAYMDGTSTADHSFSYEEIRKLLSGRDDV